jgi:hypothetical protein
VRIINDQAKASLTTDNIDMHDIFEPCPVAAGWESEIVQLCISRSFGFFGIAKFSRYNERQLPPSEVWADRHGDHIFINRPFWAYSGVEPITNDFSKTVNHLELDV